MADKSTGSEIQENSIDTAVESALSWLLHNLVTVLLIALAIDLTIMFTVPVEVTMSRWFWVKDPVSIGVAYLICKLFKSVCRHPA